MAKKTFDNSTYGYPDIKNVDMSKLGSSNSSMFLMDNYDTDSNQCIEWPFYKCNGYGRVYFCGRSHQAHRISLMLKTGEPIDTDKQALHKPIICHNRACINPNHLYWGVYMDNARDKFMDDTVQLGDDHHSSVFSEEDLAYLIQMKESNSDAAKLFKVASSAVSNFRKGKTYSNFYKENITEELKLKKEKNCSTTQKLTEKDVIEILKMQESNIDASKKFGVNPWMIGHIRMGRAWKYLYREYVGENEKNKYENMMASRFKLNKKTVYEILKSGKSCKDICRDYNISKTQARRILSGESWNSVYKDFMLENLGD